ncbi:MAG: inositol monophosphatase [Sandaracinaceae bacterium]|nr:inositol monophosphatase [Sandaracinaceae bacterium]
MRADIDEAKLRDEAIEIALAAGRLLMGGFRGETGARAKGAGGDLVTVLDERCEAFLAERLGALLPEASFVGEERGGEASALAWHVDPIDGTGNFAHGHPWFCLSIGLWAEGAARLGVIHAPAMGLTYAAARGRGATRNGAAIGVSATERLEEALLATGFPHDRATRPDNNYAEFRALDARTHGVRRCAAAALELALVADGGYDGFWDRGLSSWDVAAALSLIEEAGGRVTHLSGAPFVLAPKVDVAATNGRLHPALLDALSHVPRLPAEDLVQ